MKLTCTKWRNAHADRRVLHIRLATAVFGNWLQQHRLQKHLVWLFFSHDSRILHIDKPSNHNSIKYTKNIISWPFGLHQTIFISSKLILLFCYNCNLQADPMYMILGFYGNFPIQFTRTPRFCHISPVSSLAHETMYKLKLKNWLLQIQLQLQQSLVVRLLQIDRRRITNR